MVLTNYKIYSIRNQVVGLKTELIGIASAVMLVLAGVFIISNPDFLRGTSSSPHEKEEIAALAANLNEVLVASQKAAPPTQFVWMANPSCDDFACVREMTFYFENQTYGVISYNFSSTRKVDFSKLSTAEKKEKGILLAKGLIGTKDKDSRSFEVKSSDGYNLTVVQSLYGAFAAVAIIDNNVLMVLYGNATENLTMALPRIKLTGF